MTTPVTDIKSGPGIESERHNTINMWIWHERRCMDSQASLSDSSDSSHSVQQVLNSAPPISSSSNSHAHPIIADLYSSVENIMEDQEEIVNSYLFYQVERFCSVTQEQRMEYITSIMRRFEMATTTLARLKDEELMNANVRVKELQECLKVSREETKMWQSIANENEAMASDLRRKLQQVSDPCASSHAAVPDEDMGAPSVVPLGESVKQGKSEHDS